MKFKLAISLIMAAVMTISLPLGVVARYREGYVRVIINGTIISYIPIGTFEQIEVGSELYYSIRKAPTLESESAQITQTWGTSSSFSTQFRSSFDRPEDLTGYRRTIFNGRWVYIREGALVREDPVLWREIQRVNTSILIP